MAGKVILVGAGPGDSDLLTLKAKAAIEGADIVFYDRLVGPGILSLIPPTAKQVYVGKHAGNHTVAQGDINKFILQSALEGKHIVRLKGGDPYLFGRGAEELKEVIAHKVQFEVIPGITSAIAVPEMAGIPVTHREFSSSLHIITAHKKKDEPLDIDFESLTKLKGTLVFLMGVSAIKTIADNLIKAGMSSKTPAALIMNGTTHKQRKLVSTLGEIEAEAQAQNFASPSVFVVGEVCKLSDKLDFKQHLPLSNVSVLLTRPKNKNSMLSSQLKELGCSVTELPMIETTPVPMEQEIADKLPHYNWIVFTSPTGVQAFLKSLVEQGLDIRKIGNCKIAVVGEKTKQELNNCGLTVDFTPEVFDGEHLLQGLRERVKKSDKILLYRSALGQKTLPRELSKIVDTVDNITAYKTTFSQSQEWLQRKITEDEFNYIMFASGSAVESFVAMAGDSDFSKIKAVCIGKPTAKKAQKYNMETYISDEISLDSMVEKLLELEKKN